MSFGIFDSSGLLLYGFFMIVSQVFVAPIAHEPIIFLYAKSWSPGLLAIAGGICCCIAAVIDYLTLPKLIHHPGFRAKYENRTIYLKVQRLYSKSPFWFMVFAALTPLPAYPFKFLSVAERYPLSNYTLAQLTGRIPRFYFLATLGYAIQIPAWVIVLFAAIPFFALLIKRQNLPKIVFGKNSKQLIADC